MLRKSHRPPPPPPHHHLHHLLRLLCLASRPALCLDSLDQKLERSEQAGTLEATLDRIAATSAEFELVFRGGCQMSLVVLVAERPAAPVVPSLQAAVQMVHHPHQPLSRNLRLGPHPTRSSPAAQESGSFSAYLPLSSRP